MKQLITAERFCLAAHIAAMVFGLAGLLLVLPHPELILRLPTVGQRLFQLSMAGGGVVYILLGAAAVAIHGYRNLGLRHLLSFIIPAVFLSLSSELLGTRTGFPFGHYAYLSGLGYKIAGLVPYTIPLSWFYLGLSAYLLAYAGLSARRVLQNQALGWNIRISAIFIGAVLLTSWDFVLDPAMSQTAFPFWEWKQPGAFFGMPYQNFAGWVGTGMVFMGVADFFWGNQIKGLNRSQLKLPLTVYITNFGFAAIMSLAAGINIPVFLGIVSGLAPAMILWWMTPKTIVLPSEVFQANEEEVLAIPAVPLGAVHK
jgi:putative membrane protein